MSKPESKPRAQSAIFTDIAFEANSANGWLARADLEGETGNAKSEYIAWMKNRLRTLLDEPAA